MVVNAWRAGQTLFYLFISTGWLLVNFPGVIDIYPSFQRWIQRCPCVVNRPKEKGMCGRRVTNEAIVSSPNTTMAGRARPRPRARPTPGRYPYQNLSVSEALHAVSMKLSEVDDMRYAPHTSCRFISKQTLCLVETSPFQRFVHLSLDGAHLTLGSGPISRTKNV